MKKTWKTEEFEMCTALSLSGRHHLFGRTLDLEKSYGEGVVITQRNYAWRFRHMSAAEHNPAIIGMACVFEGYPLYYDAINEHGLAMAALNFPKSAVYRDVTEGRVNIVSYELIPWILSRASSVREAVELLSEVNVTNESVSDELPATPLHWMIADRHESVTVEAVADWLRIYENLFGVLTNEPPFPYHEAHVAEYMHLSSAGSQNRFAPSVELVPYSRGMGAIGLPGDYSSPSRFVRAVFAKSNTETGGSEADEISAFFHVLGTVSTPSGCVRSESGDAVRTIYTSCADTDTLTYYFTTYENRRIRGVRLQADGDELRFHSIGGAEDILFI